MEIKNTKEFNKKVKYEGEIEFYNPNVGWTRNTVAVIDGEKYINYRGKKTVALFNLKDLQIKNEN